MAMDNKRVSMVSVKAIRRSKSPLRFSTQSQELRYSVSVNTWVCVYVFVVWPYVFDMGLLPKKQPAFCTHLEQNISEWHDVIRNTKYILQQYTLDSTIGCAIL